MTDQRYLPLTETSFFIILSLATAPKHGYAIMKEVETMSEQRVVLATGTLYSALRRMLEDGWIERVRDNNGGTGNRERKLYQLTQQGRRILEAESDRMQKLVRLTKLHNVGTNR
ncbi:MAG: helix-turn-helix transcriptional regulator [Anaerolineales bacterium]|nr:helix-turn-helix transcriptional regulator [Anaerolineales bacterium]